MPRAGSTHLREIADVARDLGIDVSDLHVRGEHVAKVGLGAAAGACRGKLVLVTATTPTPHGEGKTVTAIALADALRRLGQTSAVTLRQPSLGPLMGIKGGATGGGRASVEPAARINLHFTGDIHAVGAAHDLIAAMTDASIHHGNQLAIDPTRSVFPRCVDVNDRELRHVVTGLGGLFDGTPRESGFVITAASETMAIHSLATSHADLKARLGRMIVGRDRDGAPVTAEQIGAHGAAAAILSDALLPNLVQTAEGTPAFVHGGPFANVSHGHSSVLADRIALARADIVVTEAGFGSDLGAEKFVDLVAPVCGAQPDVAVLVTSLRALAEQGADNLDAHLRILAALGIPAVVTLNRFPDDEPAAAEELLRRCEDARVPAVAHSAFCVGSVGALGLAELVMNSLSERPTRARPLYARDAPFEDKLGALATRVYGARGFELEARAQKELEDARRSGFDKLPLCVAKTPSSLTDEAHLRGAPSDWVLRVRDVRVEAGAGYLVVVAGDPLWMPGLGAAPAARQIDVDDEGHVMGL